MKVSTVRSAALPVLVVAFALLACKKSGPQEVIIILQSADDLFRAAEVVP